jgi:hypothetical protein
MATAAERGASTTTDITSDLDRRVVATKVQINAVSR